MRRALHATRLVVLAIAGLLLAPAPAGASVVVLVKTNLRQLDPDLPYKFYAVLYTQAIPTTTGNFLNYALGGLFRQSIIHRSVPGFVVQGGGFTYADGAYGEVPSFGTIPNQPLVVPIRGTIAMARPAGTAPPLCEEQDDPALADTATSQWFINLADNTMKLAARDPLPILDEDDQQVVDEMGRPLYYSCRSYDYTVFGRVLGDGMDVVDAIANLPRESGDLATDEAPDITRQFQSLPVLHALDPGPFGNGCAQVLEPDPMTEQPNIVCDSSCTQEQCDASIASRAAALRDVLPGELVKVNKVKLVPVVRGSDRIKIRAKSRIEHAVTGEVSKVGLTIPFTQTDWVFSIGDSTWQGIDVRDVSYDGEVYDRRGKKTILTFTADDLERAKERILSRLEERFAQVVADHEDFFRRTLHYPTCAGAADGVACFEFDDLLTAISEKELTFLEPERARLRVVEDRRRNLYKIKGSFPFQVHFRIRLSYYEEGEQLGTTKIDRSYDTTGVYQVFLSGPIRRHHD